MIKIDSDKGKITVKGTTTSLLSELTLIVKSLKEEGISKELLMESVELAFFTPEQLLKKLEDIIKKIK